MLKNTIKTVNSDGKITEVEVSIEIFKVDKEFNSKEAYQNYKKHKHEPGRKFEVSYEEFLETNLTSCNHQKLPDKLVTQSTEDEYIAGFENEFLKEALNSLSEKQRERLLMHFLDKTQC